MKTIIDINLGLESATLGTLNECVILNALNARGFDLITYRIALGEWNGKPERTLCARLSAPDDWQVRIDRLASDYGQECIACALLVPSVAPFDVTLFHPVQAPALSECQAMQAKHAAKAAEIDGWESKERFVEYLTETLIPDLKESGLEATAEDFETACKFLARDAIEEHAHKVIASLPAPYQDALYQASAAQYHARQSGQGPSFEVRP